MADWLKVQVHALEFYGEPAEKKTMLHQPTPEKPEAMRLYGRAHA